MDSFSNMAKNDAQCVQICRISKGIKDGHKEKNC